MSKLKFTPENLLANIDKLGADSKFALASMAATHLFPEFNDLSAEEKANEMALANGDWGDWIKSHHKAVKYTQSQLDELKLSES